MAIIRWNPGAADPFRDLERLQEEINRLFDFDRSPERAGIFDRAVSPAVDVLEDADSFKVFCDLPGVRPEDLEISVTDNVITIKGEKKRFEGEGNRVYRNELWTGNFQRTLSLPTSVDSGKVEATLKEGVLTLVLPKKEEHKSRQIAVKSR